MVNIWWIVAAVLAYLLFVRKASSYAGSIQAPVRRAHFDSDTYLSFGGHGANETQAGTNFAPADF